MRGGENLSVIFYIECRHFSIRLGHIKCVSIVMLLFSKQNCAAMKLKV